MEKEDCFPSYLPLQSQGTRWHKRFAADHAGVIYQVTSGDIVRTISHDVVHEVREVK